jgi:tRNA (guanine-N7-)-methyltransferase
MKAEYCSFKPLIPFYDLKRPVEWNKQFNRHAPIEVEIGFGMGEVLMRMAGRSPDKDFIGIEQHWERICKTLRAMTRRRSSDPSALGNIRILRMDARVAFERLFTSRSIDIIYCFFPCPWPKKGHIKHRLFANDFLRLVNSRLKKDGKLKIVTDFFPYCEWVLDQAKRAGFKVETKKIKPQYDTKFERKWREEGQEEFFEIDLFKKRHVSVPVKKDAVLKSYTLNAFDPRSLHLEDATGDISVIFKNMIFDENKQQAMIHALVAEEHLTQHFWITIIKKQNIWKIARAEGQNFLPTPAVAKALALVYEAARKTAP